MTNEEITEEVLNRIVGLKEYYVYAKEIVYYRQRVKARDKDHARETADGACGWEMIDGDDFEITNIEEEL